MSHSPADGAPPKSPLDTGRSEEPPRTGSGDAEAGGALERGTRIERYLLLKPVGQGGMGVVYAAYDPDLDRKVALKLLRADQKALEGAAGRALMLREAQAMARVSHPNVVPVYDVGTFAGQLFVAMEFVPGHNLKEWVTRQQRPWREVLRLFLEAGQGLVAAHRAGLVHRDFKPSNVLVSQTGRVYVMDFGLARLTPWAEAQAALAREEDAAGGGGEPVLSPPDSGLIAGTPQYMPPEQYLPGAVDARADQFSFCASLYWALYRQAPFKPRRMARAASEASQSVKRGEASAGSEAWRLLPHGPAAQEPPSGPVPAWVRRVVMRGLSLHPDDRFASMEELLQALSREQRRGDQRGTWVALGALALAGAGTGLLAFHQGQVCAGAQPRVASVWGPSARQKLEAAFAATGKPFAAQSAQGVVRLLDTYAGDWARQHTAACEATRVRGEQTEELLSLRMVCLERRLQDLGAVAGLLAEADGKVVERAVDAAAALPSLQPCQDIASLAEQPPLPAEPKLRAQVEGLGTQLAQVKALHDAGRFKAALELAGRLEPQVAATAWRPLQAELGYHRGWLLQQQGDAEAGIRQLEQAFDDAEASRSDRLRLEVLTKLIFTFANNGHPEAAQRWGKVARAILQRVGGEAPLALDLMGNLGNVALLQGRYQEAWDSFEKARELQETALGPEDPRRARVLYGLGLAAMRLGQHPRAIALLTEALKRTEAAKGPQHPEVGTRHTMLATAYRESGDLVEALAHVQAALKVRKAALGPQHPAVADTLDELGMSLLALQRYDEAIATFREAVALKTQTQGADHPDLSFSYDGVGQALLARGSAAEAIAPLRQALAYEDTEPEALAQTGFALARALWEVGGEPQGAREEARRARERYVKLEKPKQVEEIDAWLAARPEAPAPAPPSKKVRPGKRRPR